MDRLTLSGKAVTFRRVSKRLNHKFEMSGIDFRVAAGEFLTVLGPSGSGKSTLLGFVGGWVTPDRGTIEIGDVIFNDVPVRERPVRTCFQKGGFLFPHMTVQQNVGYSLKAKGIKRRRRHDLTKELLSSVGLSGIGSRRVADLSGGEAQRVAIARAIADPQPVLLLDEIETGLDTGLKKTIRQLLLDVSAERGCTVIYVTHDSAEALALASRKHSRVAVINDGKIEQVANPEVLYSNPTSSFVAAFTGEANLLSVTSAYADVVTTQGGNSFPMPKCEGEIRFLLLRPEWLLLHAESNACIPLRGRVSSVEYLGSRTRVFVDVNGDCLQVFARPDSQMGVGDELVLGVLPEKVVGLAR